MSSNRTLYPLLRVGVPLLLVGLLATLVTMAWAPVSKVRQMLNREARRQFDALDFTQRYHQASLVLKQHPDLTEKGWAPQVTGFVELWDGIGQEPTTLPFYSLELGNTQLNDCRLEGSQIQCEGFSYLPPVKGRKHPRLVDLDLMVANPNHKRAISADGARFSLADNKSVFARGQVIITPQDIQVNDGSLVLPSPSWNPNQEVSLPVGPFKLNEPGELAADTNLTWSFSLAEQLDEFFTIPETIDIAFQGNVALLLQDAEPHYEMEGEWNMLGLIRGKTAAAYSPGRYLSMGVGGARFPSPVWGVGIRLEQAWLEIDFANARLRTIGAVKMAVVAGEDDEVNQDAGMVDKAIATGLRLALAKIAHMAQNDLNLPDSFQAQCHMTLDLRKRDAAMKISTPQADIFHVVYSSGDQSILTIWTPFQWSAPMNGPLDLPRALNSFSTELTNRLRQGDFNFAQPQPLKCLPEDSGPLSPMLRRHLN